MTVDFFPAQFSSTLNTRMPPPHCPWATRPIHACRPKRLPLVLGVEGAEGLCSNASKCKLSTTLNYHHHHRCRRRHHLQLLLRVLIVARVIFKRHNPGAAETGAEDVLGAIKDLATHACPHACP